MQPRIRTDGPPSSSRDLVLQALRARGPMSRAELARQAGIAPSTISGVVRELATAGLVVSAPRPGETPRPSEAPRPGRPGLRLALNPRLGAVAGVEFCFDQVRVLLCDLAHNVVATAEHKLPPVHGSDTALAAAGRLVTKALADAGLPGNVRRDLRHPRGAAPAARRADAG